MVRNSRQDGSGGGEHSGQNLGGDTNVRHGKPGLSIGLQPLDELASHSVGVEVPSIGVAHFDIGFTLSCLLIKKLANLENFVGILLISVVIFVIFLGFLARDAVVVDERLLGVGELGPIVELGVNSVGGFVGARLVHEDSEEDVLSVGRAVGTHEEFHALVVVVVLVSHAILVGVVVHRIFVDFETTALQCLLDVELLLSVLVLVVVVAHVAVVEPGVEVALVFACLVVVGVVAVAVLADAFAVVFLGIHFAFHVGVDEFVHVNNVIGTILAGRRTAVRRTKLEMNEPLLIHPIVPIPVIVIVIVIIVVIPLTAEVSPVIIMGRRALLELDGVIGYPGEVVVSVEATSAGEEGSSDAGGGGDAVGGRVDLLGGGGEAKG